MAHAIRSSIALGLALVAGLACSGPSGPGLARADDRADLPPSAPTVVPDPASKPAAKLPSNDTDGGPDKGEPSYLTLVNRTPTEVCHVYGHVYDRDAYVASAPEIWGDDLLAGKVLAPDESTRIDLAVGEWTLRFEYCSAKNLERHPTKVISLKVRGDKPNRHTLEIMPFIE